MKRIMLVLSFAGTCAGQGPEFWETIDAGLLNRGGVDVVLHTQVRLRDRLKDFFQARIGPVIRYRLSPRNVLIGGYYFGGAEDKERVRWGNNHRTFAGVETALSVSLTVRSLVEHHFGGGFRQEVRFREQLQWVRKVRGPVASYATTETFLDQDGFFIQRFTGGVRLMLFTGYRIDLGYLYDARLHRAGGVRHAVQFGFRPRERERSP